MKYVLFIPLGLMGAVLLLEAVSIEEFGVSYFYSGRVEHIKYRPVFGPMNYVTMTINKGFLKVLGMADRGDLRGDHGLWMQYYSREKPRS